MSALTSGSSVIISVSRESPNLFPSHSLGFRSCLSHLMLICRRQGRAGEGVDSLLWDMQSSAIMKSLSWTFLNIYSGRGREAEPTFCWELNTLGNLGECMKPAAGLEGRRSAGQHVQPFPVFVHLANWDSSSCFSLEVDEASSGSHPHPQAHLELPKDLCTRWPLIRLGLSPVHGEHLPCWSLPSIQQSGNQGDAQLMSTQ